MSVVMSRPMAGRGVRQGLLETRASAPRAEPEIQDGLAGMQVCDRSGHAATGVRRLRGLVGAGRVAEVGPKTAHSRVLRSSASVRWRS